MVALPEYPQDNDLEDLSILNTVLLFKYIRKVTKLLKNHHYLRILMMGFLLYSPELHAQTVSIGSYSIGHSSVKIDFNDFQFKNKNEKIKVKFKEDTLQWIRSDKNLLTPQVSIQIDATNDLYPLYIKYKDQLIVPTQEPSGQFSSQFYINLFSPGKIQFFHHKNLIDEVFIVAKPIHNNTKQWIDTSCIPYSVSLDGISSEYVSVGCSLKLIGSFGNETTQLEVNLSSTNLISPIDSEPPFIFYFNQSAKIKTKLIHATTKEEVPIELSATLPERFPRLKIAGGLGPYHYKSEGSIDSVSRHTTLSYMLYGKLNLTETTSFKAFDALIYDKTIFNNSGLYYSFELSRFFDGRIVLGTLLGLQGLHYKFDKTSPTLFKMIYPQGFELTYLHPFDQKNYYLSYGMFISTTQDLYQNIWLRYGSKFFYEANYIAWGKDLNKIEMFGLSVGFPLMQFF